MKYRLAAFAVALFVIPTAVRADESWGVARYKAAFETNDWPFAPVYCTPVAQDSVDASADKGHARALDLTTERQQADALQ